MKMNSTRNSSKKLTRLIVVMLLSVVIIGSLPLSITQADYNSQRLGLSYSYPTTYSDWANGFLAGNGKMGIIVFGNPLNETTIYNDRGFFMAASSERSFNQVSAADLTTIRNNCAAGNFAAANTLAVNASGYAGGGEGNKHPGYEMLISIPQNGTVSNYSRTCNYRTGEIAVNWTDNLGNWVRKSFVSRQDNVIVQYLTAPTSGTISCSIQLSTDPGMHFDSGMTFTNASNINYLNMRVAYPSNTNGAGYEGVTRVVTSGGTKTMNGNVMNISGANSVIMLTRTAKYYSNCVNTWNLQNLQNQLAAISTDYTTLLNGQIATHQAIYDRVKLDLNANATDRARTNEDLLSIQKNSSTPVKALYERIFDAGRYLYLSSSSDQSPPDLLGLWTGDSNVGWQGFYHLDANLNVQIDGGNVGDMPEAMEGYFTAIERWRAGFETNATKLLGCRGMLGGGNTAGLNGLMANINTYYPYQYATGEMGWLLYPFWEHYQITGDNSFLQNRLYPLLKEMGYFYEDFLKSTDGNGKYIFAGSVSPENQPSNLAVSLLNNSTFDIGGAKFCLTALIQTCNTLGLDQGAGQGVERWTNILNKLPPYLINSDGALQEWSWPGLNDNYNHRHSSHMITVWPLREITPENNATLFNAAVTTLTKKDAYSYENAGHGILHAALIAANLKNDQSVNTKLLRLAKEDFYFNSLASSHYNAHNVFCTDTCNAVPGIMIEMLVCSSPGTLELLPALPQSLDIGAISGVKGRNRVTVQSLSWNMGSSSVNCTLKSDIAQSITLIERNGIDTISTSATVSASPLGQIARVVQLQAGVSTNISIGLGQLKPTNLALNKPVTVSSVADNTVGSNAVDGNTSTRWSSGYTDNEWIYVDLGSAKNLTGVKLTWESAYGRSYKIQVSNDATNWTDVYSTTTGDGGIDQISFTASGRYVRMLGVQRATTYGFSLWEFEVDGSTGGGTPVPTPTPTPANTSTPTPANTPTPTPTPVTTNLALSQPVTVSSVADSCPGPNAVDGNTSTRWSSAYTDPQWIYVDLGSSKSVSSVKLNWEAAYGKSYKIQVSNDASTWTDVYSTATGAGGVENITFTATNTRYVRMYGTQRATTYGYSLWEYEVYGSGGGTPTPTPTPGAATKYEAESGTVGNGATIANDSAASGGKCIQNLHLANSYFQVGNIDGGSGGSKTLHIIYAENGTGTVTVYVNGTSAGTISCPTTGGWSTFTGNVQKTITLNSGTGNTIKIVGGAGGINADYITVQ
jgi:hypothetical protein